MTALNKGVSGAKRATYSGSSPRELLVRIMEACHEKAHDDTIYTKFEDAVLDDNLKCGKAIIRWWFDNNIKSLRDIKGQPAPRRVTPLVARHEQVKARALQEAKTAEVVEIMKRNMAKIVLREMLLPNGKKLKDCKFGEIRKLAPQLDGWLTRVGASGKRDEIVGRVLSEPALQDLYNASVGDNQ